jgi:hypothetical protein
MTDKRQKIFHLRGTNNLTIEKANELEFGQGEIAIKHGSSGDSELYVLTQDGTNIDSFVSKSYIDNTAKQCATKENFDALAERVTEIEKNQEGIAYVVDNVLMLKASSASITNNTLIL